MIYRRGYLARPFDAVLGHASRLAALRALMRAKESLSGRQVASRAGINHQAAALALRDLEKVGLVRRREAARSIQWTVDRAHYLVDEVLQTLFETEVRHVDDVVAEIKNRIGRKADFVVIVGDATRGRLAPGKPLEISFLCELGRRRALNEAVHGLAGELDARFGIGLKADFLTKSQAVSRLDLLDGWQLLPTEGRPAPFSGAR